MEKRENILTELREISPAVAEISKENILSVPNNYFANLAETVLLNIKEQEDSIHFSAANPFRVPSGYFEGLASNILRKVNTQKSETFKELEELSPLLNTISRRNVYAVPDGYFDQLEFKSPKVEAKIISLGNTRKIVRYAAAAVVTGIIAVSSWLFVNKEEEATTRTDNSTINVATAVNDLSEEDIFKYLDTHSTASDAASIDNTDEPILNVDDLMEEMPEEDIQEFLNEG